MRVTIVKWEKFNARKDVLRCHWFRIDHDIFENRAFYDLEVSDWAVLLYFLCQASKESSATVDIHFEHAKRVAKLSKALIESAVKKLQSSQFVHVDVTPPSALVTQTCSTQQDTTEQDKTEQNNNGECVFLDFESLYQKYPRKLGKSAGLRKAKSEIRSHEDFDLLSKALDRFCTHHKERKTEPEYLPYFSTFITSWRDWLDPATGSAISQRQSISEMILGSEAAHDVA